jgi:hypothetical protein
VQSPTPSVQLLLLMMMVPLLLALPHSGCCQGRRRHLLPACAVQTGLLLLPA